MMIDNQSEHKDRRKKTPFDFMSSVGGAGSAGISSVLLVLVLNQNSTMESNKDLIKDNRHEQGQITTLLKDMRSEFKVDIQEFKLKHVNLESQMSTCDVTQQTLVNRVTTLESQRNDPDVESERLKRWVSENFVRREKM